MEIDNNKLEAIISAKGRQKNNVIPILQAIQKEYKYLPQNALDFICNKTDITPAEITSVASFYSQFRFQPVGEHIIKVCVGTACHVKGAMLVHDAFKREFNLKDNQHTDPSGKYTIEKVSCLGCCTLAPVVQIDQVTYGHVATGQIKNILSDFESIKDKKEESKYRTGAGEKWQGEIRIGLGSCCVASGSDEIRKTLQKTVSKNQFNINIKQVGCVGMCHRVPLVEVVPEKKDSKLYSRVKPEDIKNIVNRHFKPPHFLQRLKNNIQNTLDNIQTDESWDGVERYSIDKRDKQVSDFLGKQIPIATEYRGILNPLDIEEYKAGGGFTSLSKALHMSRDEIIKEIKESGIRGRGGAGFPSGIKWETVAKQKEDTKYLICNGDEGDPGAFMDRMLLESYPYRIIEGMLIAAYATGIRHGFFYIRAEYPLAVHRVNTALAICREKKCLGENILGSDFSFDIEIIEGAGAFVCGEETALIASIEGKRGFPKIRPPFPAEKGLWNKPTLVNNTETLAQIPYIIKEGAKKFRGIGSENSKGTKVFALAGKVNRGGLIEVPMGLTIREVIEDIGGGVANNRKFKAVQIGGPSGGCVPYWLADIPVDFQSLNEVGAMMGSGGFVVLDDTDCMVDIARYFLSFTQNESCGKCTFCRIGTYAMLEILNRICAGKGMKGDIEKLEKLAHWTGKGSLCGLGKTAPNPVLSTLKYFRDEYEAHINGICPTGKCKDLITYSINDNCIGCSICAQQCPANAIEFKPLEKHEIKTDKCIKCDTCRQVCPENAVTVN